MQFSFPNLCVIQINYYSIRQYQILRRARLASADFQCVNYQYAKFEYKGILSLTHKYHNARTP